MSKKIQRLLAGILIGIAIILPPFSAKGDETEKWAQEETYQNLQEQIMDVYGILDQPHHYAVKLVKFEGAKGRLETYEKTEEGYRLKNVYAVTYSKEGRKSKYGDMKTVGGPYVRYMYRTIKSSMDGRDKDGNSFGVYKISYPMPHDALPYLMAGKMSKESFNQIPVIAKNSNGDLIPHPQGILGADILIHTAKKGSRGCINVENEAMSALYWNDLASENDRELIPLVIYDEDMEAPPTGSLF